MKCWVLFCVEKKYKENNSFVIWCEICDACLEGGPLMWMLPLHLHINQKWWWWWCHSSFQDISSSQKVLITFFTLHGNVGTLENNEAFLLSTHNICFCGEIRKIFSLVPPLIWSMNSAYFSWNVLIVNYSPFDIFSKSLLACLDKVQEELLHYPLRRRRGPHLR